MYSYAYILFEYADFFYFGYDLYFILSLFKFELKQKYIKMRKRPFTRLYVVLQNCSTCSHTLF